MKSVFHRQREEVASGGLARIFKLVQASGTVAEKELLPKYQGRMEYENIQRREFEILSQLQHSNLPKVYRLKMSNSKSGLPTHVIEMEWIEGVSVFEVLSFLESKEPELRTEFAKYFLLEMQSIVNYFQQKNLIHADLNPENLILAKNARLYVIDFGSSRFADEPSLGSLRFIGKPSYRAPEVRDGGVHSHKSDLYSVGRILEEILGHALEKQANFQEWVRELMDQRKFPEIDFESHDFPLESIEKPSNSAKFSPEKTQEILQRTKIYKTALRAAAVLLCWLNLSTFQQVATLQVNTLPRSQVCIQSSSICFGETPLLRIRTSPGFLELEFRAAASTITPIRRRIELRAGETSKFFEDFRNTDTL